MRSALEGPKAYTAEGLRQPLGALSKDPRGDDAYSAGRRKGLSGMQGNLEGVKTELDLLQSKVSNDDGTATLKGIVSSIQSMQEHLDKRERQRVYEDPYRNEPQLPKGCEDAPWNNPPQPLHVSLGTAPENKQEPKFWPCEDPAPRDNPWRGRPISFRTALDKWRE